MQEVYLSTQLQIFKLIIVHLIRYVSPWYHCALCYNRIISHSATTHPLATHLVHNEAVYLARTSIGINQDPFYGQSVAPISNAIYQSQTFV